MTITRLIFIALCVVTSSYGVAEETTYKSLVHGGQILTMDPNNLDPIDGWFLVDTSGRIAEIGTGHVPEGISAETVINASGKIILPGFISAHSHLWSAPFTPYYKPNGSCPPF